MFAALTARLIYVEVVNGPKLQARALEQWYRDVPLQGERGAIYDATGRLLADSRTVYTVYVRPVSVTNKEETASILSSALGLDYDVLLSKLNSRVSEITVKKNVEKDVMLAIASSAATGVYGSQSIKRIYPYGNYLTQILGFTNVDGEGQTGIEKYYDQYLRGRDGYVLTATDLIGRELESAETYYVPGSQGATTYLTVDGHIQSFAESAVDQAMLTYQPKGASCIVMNVNTGAILAMAQRPSFDLNDVPRDNVAELLQNSKSSLISGVFEPGSTFKIITSAIGLDTGAISRNHAVYCPGYRMVDGQRIKCWRTIGHGSQTFDEGVQNSCNCLFMDAALAIGTDTFYDRIRAFGLTSKTGIDMSGEASGLTIPQESVKTVDLARMGFGQAIAVTPLELVRAAAAVVNGGKLVTPYLVDRIVGTDGSELYRAFPETSGSVISAETSAAMREILEKVVSEGSGKNAQVSGYRIGGKTGTAQKYENGVIAQGKYVSTFLGFAPADQPEYIALMIVDEPQGGVYYGSLVAAPYIGEIFAKIFAYRGMAPVEQEGEKRQFEMPDVVGKSLSEGILDLRKFNLYYESVGEGSKIIGQIPVAGSVIDEDTVVWIEIGQ